MRNCIGLDTNILARYYAQPAADDVADQRQHALAAKLMDSGQPLAVCKTVLLELAWVLRGFYGYSSGDIVRAFAHLLAQAHIEIEDRQRVKQALRNHAAGLDFADAMHHASYADCQQIASFDDRGFVRRSSKLNLSPAVVLPR
jgi:predicted nucleic-acid-binding protein